MQWTRGKEKRTSRSSSLGSPAESGWAAAAVSRLTYLLYLSHLLAYPEGWGWGSSANDAPENMGCRRLPLEGRPLNSAGQRPIARNGVPKASKYTTLFNFLFYTIRTHQLPSSPCLIPPAGYQDNSEQGGLDDSRGEVHGMLTTAKAWIETRDVMGKGGSADYTYRMVWTGQTQ